MIGILVVTHGQFGEDLVKTVSAIMKDTENLRALNLSRRLDFQTLRSKVLDQIKAFNATKGIVVLVDAYGGTSYNTTLPLVKEHNLCLVTGVNLPMVLSALANRKRMSAKDLARKIAEDAKKTISVLSDSDIS